MHHHKPSIACISKIPLDRLLHVAQRTAHYSTMTVSTHAHAWEARHYHLIREVKLTQRRINHLGCRQRRSCHRASHCQVQQHIERCDICPSDKWCGTCHHNASLWEITYTPQSKKSSQRELYMIGIASSTRVALKALNVAHMTRDEPCFTSSIALPLGKVGNSPNAGSREAKVLCRAAVDSTASVASS